MKKYLVAISACSLLLGALPTAFAQIEDAVEQIEEVAELPECPVLLDEAGEPVVDEDGATVYDTAQLPVLDDEGDAVLGEDGEPLMQDCAIPEPALPACSLLLDEDGVPTVDEDGALVYDTAQVPVLGEDSEPMLDEGGEALMQDCAVPAAPECPPLLDEEGEPVVGEDGEAAYDESPVPVLNEAGEPYLGADGEPLSQACAIPSEEPVDAESESDVVEEPEQASSPIMRLLNAGGPIIVILAVLAVLALGVGLVKLVQFVYLGVGRNGFVHEIIEDVRDGEDEKAIRSLDERHNPVGRVMAAALRGKNNPKMSDTLVREETTRVAQAQLDGLERGLALLSLIATIAPLLGLLGTVLGMIEAFQQMETVGDRVEPAVLAGGIWEALLTTAAGLSVAIPAAVLFTWLQRAVDVEAQKMEDAATQVFTLPLYDAKSD